MYQQGPRLPPKHEARYLTAFEELMLRWKDSDVEFFVPQLAAVLMSKGVPSRNVHVSVHRCPGVAGGRGKTHGTGGFDAIAAEPLRVCLLG